MPRHNFNAAKPYVREFCKKYDLEYDVKPIWTGFGDIVRLFTECSSAHNTTLHISKPIVDVCVLPLQITEGIRRNLEWHVEG